MFGLNFKMAATLAVGAIVIILAWQLKLSYARIGELKVKLANQVQETIEAANANESNMTTIATLETRIATMIEERRIDSQRREELLAERERELLRARARADQLEDERKNEQKSNIDCAELSALVVESFCPATARQLRERSRGQDSNQDGDSH